MGRVRREQLVLVADRHEHGDHGPKTK